MHISYVLQLNVPFAESLGREVEAVSLMSYVVVLAKHAAEVAAREEDAAGAVLALDAWFCVQAH